MSTLKEKGAAAKAKLAAVTGVRKAAVAVIATTERAIAPKKATAATRAQDAAKKASQDALATFDAKNPAPKPRRAAAPKAEPAFDLNSAAEAELAAGVSVPAAEDGLKRVVELGNMMLRLEREMQDAEIAFMEAKDRYRKLEQGDLPDLMSEIGLTMFKMPDGSVFELVEDVQCGISEERRPAAHRWIRDNGFAGLIKTEIKALFSPDQLDRADALEASMAKDGLEPERKEAIHHSRLKSFVKERLEAGEDIPFDLFGIHPFNKVKYKQPKGKR